MPNASVSGLVSGLDTATIISQLMQIEAQPQTLLKNQVSTSQTVVGALQGINAKIATLAAKAADLAKSTAWTVTRATSSNDKVLVTAAPGTAPTSIGFTVGSLASSARVAYATTGTTSSAVMAANTSYTVTYADGRSSETISTGDGTLQGVADAINATTGLKATLVRYGTAADGVTPTYQLNVASATTGAHSDFTISETSPVDPANPVPFMGGAAGTTPGADASITLDGQSTPLSFSTNTITNLLPGVDVTLTPGAENTSATITVSRDVDSLSASVKAMVDSVNAVLDEIGTQTAYDATTKTAGLLVGDSTVEDVRNQLLDAVTHGIGSKSLAAVGIQVDRDGKLVFDDATFKSAYAADPAGTAAMIGGTDPDPAMGGAGTNGFADELASLGTRFSDSIDGTVTLSIKSRQASIKGMQDDIADWDVRLADRQATLQRQFTAMETALGTLQSQSSWLSGQIASLPTIGR